MQGKILVAYASKSGWTAEVAQEVGNALKAQGLEVDVTPADAVTGLEGYGAVVVGSGVRVGKWLPQATAFIDKHRARLEDLPTAIFTVHMLGGEDTEEARLKRESYVAPVKEMISPVAEGYFAGGIEMNRLSLVERLMTKAVKPPLGDFRDLDAIRAWAEGLPAALEG